MERPQAELEKLIEKMERIGEELDADPGEERAAELVREASQLAADARHVVDAALRDADARDA